MERELLEHVDEIELTDRLLLEEYDDVLLTDEEHDG